MEIDHRVGYVRPGYDADVVVWDSHPLSLGATALQVYIDGKPTLDSGKVADSLSAVSPDRDRRMKAPKMRKVPPKENREETCSTAEKKHANFTLTGITKSYLDESSSSSAGNYTLVFKDGRLVCFDSHDICSSSSVGPIISLENGYVSPGLTAVTVSLGLAEIPTPEASDGLVSQKSTNLDHPEDVVYAKYGVHLDGRAFLRARIGGVTRAVTAPMANGFVGGVSVGIGTSGKKSVLDGGIFQEDVALHYTVGLTSTGRKIVSSV